MSLQEVSKEIHKFLLGKKSDLAKELDQAEKEIKKAQDVLRVTPKHDARENAQLQAAIEDLRRAEEKFRGLLEQQETFQQIKDIDNYNSIGRVMPYSTVRLSRQFAGRDTFRLYEGSLSYIDKGVLSLCSDAGASLLYKSVGDFITLNDESKVQILEIY